MASFFTDAAYLESTSGDLPDTSPNWIFGAGTKIYGVTRISAPYDVDVIYLDHTETASHPRSVAPGTIVQFSVNATNVQWFHLQVRDAVTGSLLFQRLKDDLSGNFQPNYAFSGSFTMPNADVTFTIDGGDQSLGLISYILTINEVAAQNRPPIVVPHQATVTSGQTVTIPIVGPTLDHDPDGDQLTITAPPDTPHGHASVSSNNSIIYTPNAGFSGTDSFQYTISDGHNPVTGTVTVNVTGAAPKIEVHWRKEANPPPDGWAIPTDPAKMRAIHQVQVIAISWIGTYH
jgi:hypothetical protein